MQKKQQQQKNTKRFVKVHVQKKPRTIEAL